jgi:hypothetical protein
MDRYATSFEEYVDIIATESPHAAIMDWWRRLNLALDHYIKELGKWRGKAKEVERHVASDPKLGPGMAARLCELRLMRNAVAHENVGPLSLEAAIPYAKDTFQLIGALTFPRQS